MGGAVREGVRGERPGFVHLDITALRVLDFDPANPRRRPVAPPNAGGAQEAL